MIACAGVREWSQTNGTGLAVQCPLSSAGECMERSSSGQFGGVMWIERTHLARELWRYGEDDVWRRVLSASDSTMEAIGARAEWHTFQGESAANGGSMLIDRAFALAAVEVLEGHGRPLL